MMKSKYIAIGLLMLIGGVACTHEFDNHKNTPSENFEALWQIIDEKYCLFDDKQVDWDSVYAVYQPQFDTMKVVAFGDQYRMFDLMEEMLNTLEDGHVNLYTPFDVSVCSSWLEHKPKLIIGGASAYSREWDYARMREIADKVGAIFWVDMAHTAGLIAAGLLSNPVKYAHIVTSTTHKTLRGPRGGIILMGKDFDNPWGLTTPKGVVKKMSQILNSSVFPGVQGGPLEHCIAAKAVSFYEALQPEFKEYQKQVISNANAMAEAFKARGYKIVSGGTDNHLLLIDLRTKFPEVTGKVAEKELGKADITLNKNMVPFDSRTPFQTSGIRVGTPAITSRGFVEKDMEFIVNLIDMVLTNAAEHLDLIAGKTEEGREAYEEVLDKVKKQVRMKTNGMPLNRY